MTVNTSNITSGPYDGNGSNKDFSYTFRIDDTSQLLVYVIDSGNNITLKTLTTDYTVSGVGNDAGGTVTFVTAPASTDDVYIRSNYAATQLTDFDSQGGFFPDVHEDAIDKLTFLVQQLQDQVDRCVRIDQNDPTGSLSTVAQLVSSTFLQVNNTANGFNQVTLGTVGVAAEVTLADYNSFRNNTGFTVGDYSDGQVIWFTNDGIRGAFILRSGASPADDGGLYIRSTVDTNRYVERVQRTPIKPEWFGAVGDGTTNDSAAFVTALAKGDVVSLEPDTVYLINAQVTLASYSSLVCHGGMATIKSTVASSLDVFTGSSITDNIFMNIKFDMPVCSGALDVTPVGITGATRFYMINCHMDDGYDMCHIFGGTDVYFDKCIVNAHYSFGVILAGTIDGAWVTDGRFSNSINGDGIKVAGSVTAEAPTHKNIHIYGNTCYGNNRDGIDCAVNDGENINIRDNILYDNDANAIEFKLLDTDPVSIKDSKVCDNVIGVSSSTGTGITVIAASAASTTLFKNVMCNDNHVECSNTSGQTGIKFTNIYRSEMSNNRVEGSLYAYRFLASSNCTMKTNTARGSGNMVLLATDGTNSPADLEIKDNVSENTISRTYYVTDSSTSNIKCSNNKSDAPIDSLDGTGWEFTNGAASIMDKTANFNVYATHDGATFTNQGAAGNVIFLINDVRKGLEYTFYQTQGGTLNMDISPPAGVTIGGGGSGKDMYLRTDNGNVTIRAMSTTHFEIVSDNGVTITYEP